MQKFFLTRSTFAFQEISESFRSFFKQEAFGKKFFFCCLCYLAGFLAILHADYIGHKDIDLLYQTNTLEISFFPWLNHLFSFVLFAGRNIQDIAPVPQILSIGVLALSSVMLVSICCQKTSYLKLLLATIFGLSPYFLANMTSRFNCLTETLSLCVALVPFLFWMKCLPFLVMSVYSLSIILMFYWPAFNVYLLLYVFKLSQKVLSEKKITSTDLFSFLLLFVVFLWMLLETKQGSVYALYNTFKTYIQTYWGSNFLGVSCLFLSVAFAVCFCLSFGRSLKNLSRLDSFLLSIWVVGLLIFWGIVNGISFTGTSVVGIGVGCLISLELLFLVDDGFVVKKIIFYCLGCAIVYQLILFGNKYGNILIAQKDYEQATFELLNDELSQRKIKDVSVSKTKFYSPLVLFKAKEYPLYKDLIYFDLESPSYFYSYMNGFLNAYIQPCQKMEKSKDKLLKETQDWQLKEINSSCVEVQFK